VDHGFAIGEEDSSSPHCRRHVHDFLQGFASGGMLREEIAPW